MIGVGWLILAYFSFPRGRPRGVSWCMAMGYLGPQLLFALGGMMLIELKVKDLITSDGGENVKLDSSHRKVTNINYKF
jgi:hypothetical protein